MFEVTLGALAIGSFLAAAVASEAVFFYISLFFVLYYLSLAPTPLYQFAESYSLIHHLAALAGFIALYLFLPAWLMDAYELFIIFVGPAYCVIEGVQIVRISMYCSRRAVATFQGPEADSRRTTLVKICILLFSAVCYGIAFKLIDDLDLLIYNAPLWFIVVFVMAFLTVFTMVVPEGIISDAAFMTLILSYRVHVAFTGSSIFLKHFAPELIAHPSSDSAGTFIALSPYRILDILISGLFACLVLWSLGLDLFFDVETIATPGTPLQRKLKIDRPEPDDDTIQPFRFGSSFRRPAPKAVAAAKRQWLHSPSVVKTGIVLLATYVLADVLYYGVDSSSGTTLFMRLASKLDDVAVLKAAEVVGAIGWYCTALLREHYSNED